MTLKIGRRSRQLKSLPTLAAKIFELMNRNGQSVPSCPHQTKIRPALPGPVADQSMAGKTMGDSIPVTLRDREGQIHNLEFATVPPPKMQGVPKLMPSRLPGAPPVPIWLQHVERNFWMNSLSDGSLCSQSGTGAEGTAQSGTELGAELMKNRPSRIILDVRHNNGGNSYLYPPIIDALIAWESVVPAGKLYVLTGRNTFSAAQNFIAQLDRRTRAIFVGEPSSSKPNFVGEENDLLLPWSGAIASISNRYNENIPGDKRKWIEPDIRIELSSKDYFHNRDPWAALHPRPHDDRTRGRFSA